MLRGHLELLDTGNPQEVAETQALLLDELDRMSRLVEDMTLLAKSNRPDFLNLDSVELDQLTRAAYAKAMALGDRDWVLDEAGEATVEVDPQRITQAILQLADNAVKHTDPGDEISIGSAVEAGRVRIWVRDTGDGSPEAEQALIFERSNVRTFARRRGIRPGPVDRQGHRSRARWRRDRARTSSPQGAEFTLSLPWNPLRMSHGGSHGQTPDRRG